MVNFCEVIYLVFSYILPAIIISGLRLLFSVCVQYMSECGVVFIAVITCTCMCACTCARHHETVPVVGSGHWSTVCRLCLAISEMTYFTTEHSFWTLCYFILCQLIYFTIIITLVSSPYVGIFLTAMKLTVIASVFITPTCFCFTSAMHYTNFHSHNYFF